MNYSFTGGDVGDARTVGVELFEARAPLATPLSVQLFTESLRDLLLAQTPLKLKTSQADVQYSGSLTGYDVQPVNIQANETAALNRLTITRSATYINTLDTQKNLEFSVSRFSDYDSSQDLGPPWRKGWCVRIRQTIGPGHIRPHFGKLVVQACWDRSCTPP